jgi:hypothetical protein
VIRGLVLAVGMTLMLTGCLGTSLPSTQTPSCSWDSRVPANSASICSAVYRTLNTVAHAQQMGDNRTVARLATKPSVRKRLIAYGRTIRAQGAQNLHVVPSLTLTRIRRHLFGAGFYLNVRGGRTNAPETMELRVEGPHAVIINDQPGQEW